MSQSSLKSKSSLFWLGLTTPILGVKRGFWILGLICLGLVGLAGFRLVTDRQIVDRSLASEADFSVYSPSQAPEGYELTRSPSLSGQILTYSFEAASGSTIAVTNQPRPTGFDISQMSKGGSISSIATNSGTLYDLSIGQSGQFLLDTGDALIYFTSPSRIDIVTVSSLANDLQKIN